LRYFRLCTRVIAVCAMLLGASAGRASAQNLFEVQVFPDETVGRGETELEIHNVVMPSGTRLPDEMLDPSRHVHLSFEVTHGWSSAFETGVFVETSPFGDDRHPALTGFHFRPKYRLAEWPPFPFHVSVSLEYAFIKNPGDVAFRQAVAFTPILERHIGRFEMSFNPSVEIAVRGPDAGSSPVFEPSAKAASRISRSVWLGVEYYAETGSIRRLEPLAEQHHLILPVVDIRSPAGWELNLGAGRGLTGGSEHWVVKSILGVPLTRH
jgi:hypothetical protein